MCRSAPPVSAWPMRAVSKWDRPYSWCAGATPRGSTPSAWTASNHVKNAWARNLTAIHFYHGPAFMNDTSKWITVQDCNSLAPVSVITGGRRYPYCVEGQLILVQHCHSAEARHAFVFGARVPGPN